MKEKFGNNAGIVWNALVGQGEMSLKEVKKVTKLTEKELYAAIGWLAREEKILAEEKESDIFIILV